MSINRLGQYITELVNPDERPVMLWSFLFFFCLLAGYFILRPIREQMATAGGLENIQWFYLVTLGVMLLLQPIYGKIVSKYPRKKFMPYLFGFCTGFIFFLWLLLSIFGQRVYLARIFFTFVSVYNVFTVSLFWSFMADVLSQEQGKRLFGLIASGGSLGAIFGTQIPIILVDSIGTINLVFIAFLFMLLVLLALFKLCRYAVSNDLEIHKEISGSIMEGAQMILQSRLLRQIALLVVISTFLGSVLYAMQIYFVGHYTSDPDQRTKLYSQLNFYTNLLSLFFQFVLTPYLLQRFSIHRVLAIMPVVMVMVFALIGLVPMIYVALGGVVIQRSFAYGLMKPPTDWLFTGMDDKTKYKFKNFLDTVIYRTGDTLAQWFIKFFTVLISRNIQVLALLALVVSVYWVKNALTVGRMVIQQKHTK